MKALRTGQPPACSTPCRSVGHSASSTSATPPQRASSSAAPAPFTLPSAPRMKMAAMTICNTAITTCTRMAVSVRAMPRSTPQLVSTIEVAMPATITQRK